MPTEAGGYALNLDADQSAALGLGEADPLVDGIREHFHKAGLSQGRFDDFMKTAGDLAKAGLFGSAGIDAQAELAKLGEGGEGRRREVEIFADALVARDDGFDDEMRGELMSLAPTAAGVKLVEYLRKAGGQGLVIDPPADLGAAGGATIEKAKAMARDPRYGKDGDFTKDADRVWQEAHRKRP